MFNVSKENWHLQLVFKGMCPSVHYQKGANNFAAGRTTVVVNLAARNRFKASRHHIHIYIYVYTYIYTFDFHVLCITYVYRWVCDYKTHAWCFQRFLVALWSLFFMFWHELITVLIPVKLFSFIHYGSVSFPKVCDVQPTDSYTQNNNYQTNQQCQW